MKKDVPKFILLLIFIFLVSLVLIVQVQADGEGMEVGEEDKPIPIVCTAYGTDYPQEPQSSPILIRQSRPLSRISSRSLIDFSLLISAIFLLIVFLLIKRVRTLDTFVLEYKPRKK
jgi:hypothetical protein